MAALFFAACSRTPEAPPTGMVEVRSHDAWTEVFRPGEGPYLGASRVRTTKFGGRTYAFFNDVLVGHVEGGEVEDGAKFVRNAVAELDDRGLIWLTDLEGHRPFIGTAEPGSWYWFGHPSVSPDGQTLSLFAHRMTRRGVVGPFDFRLAGCDILQWRGESLDQPPKVFPLPQCSPGEGATGDLTWGVWTLVDAPYMWIFGVRDNQPKELLVARAPLEGFDDDPTRGWTYWKRTGFAESKDEASPALLRVSDGMGVVRRGDEYLAIYQRDGRSSEVVVSTATSAAGPWSPPRVLWNVELPEHRSFAYDATPHPALSERGLVISTSVNTSDFFGAYSRLHTLYYPRFIQWNL